MTYCLGIITPDGLVLASDSRSNAGVDQLTVVSKLAIFDKANERIIAIQSAGNLATTQAVITTLRQSSDPASTAPGEDGHLNLFAARTMFDVAEMVGETLRSIVSRDAHFVQPYGDVDASFIVAGQIKGEPHRLFQIYAAGNFVEASSRAQFFQLGETKYGKPILDRALDRARGLDDVAKIALLSFDATMRSNVSVAQPIDMLRYTADSFTADRITKYEIDNPYWLDLTRRYSEGLVNLVESLPLPI